MTGHRAGALIISPIGQTWTVTRRWTGSGRFTMVTIRSESGDVRHLPASVVDEWQTA